MCVVCVLCVSCEHTIQVSVHHTTRLEDAEHLLDVDGLVDGGEVLDDVEAHRLGERSALADGHDVALAHVLKGGRHVHRHVAVLLRETAVLGEVLQVVSAHDHGALHLVRDHHRLQDAAADRHVAREGALLVHVVALDRGLGSLEAQADADGDRGAGDALMACFCSRERDRERK